MTHDGLSLNERLSGMRCHKSALIASAHLDQRLTQNEVKNYRAHIEICANCRAHLTELEQMSLILKNSHPPEASPDLRSYIMSVITAE
jgi:hypothetical protein